MSRFGDDMGRCSCCKKTINLNLFNRNDKRYCQCTSTHYLATIPKRYSFKTPDDYYADSTYGYNKIDQQHVA